MAVEKRGGKVKKISLFFINPPSILRTKILLGKRRYLTKNGCIFGRGGGKTL